MLKLFHNLLKKLRHKALLYVFNRYYGRYVYSFEDAEIEFAKLSPASQTMYYEEITAWVNSKAYEIEGKGQVKQMYLHLATESKNEDEMMALRMALLKHKNMDLRLRQKAEEYKKKQIIYKRSNSFDKQ